MGDNEREAGSPEPDTSQSKGQTAKQAPLTVQLRPLKKPTIMSLLLITHG